MEIRSLGTFTHICPLYNFYFLFFSCSSSVSLPCYLFRENVEIGGKRLISFPFFSSVVGPCAKAERGRRKSVCSSFCVFFVCSPAQHLGQLSERCFLPRPRRLQERRKKSYKYALAWAKTVSPFLHTRTSSCGLRPSSHILAFIRMRLAHLFFLDLGQGHLHAR